MADPPPSMVFVMADDLGTGELGCYGQTKIRTPWLDRLASEGMRFTQHYAGNAVCAPSRCVWMTGRHPGHAQVRDNREIQPEGQFPLAAGTPTLPLLLQGEGYVTGAFGKWGLGAPGSPGDPLRQGFDRFFGYNCQRAAHNFYPTSLYDNARMVVLNNPAFAAHQRLPVEADPADPQAYAAYAGADYAPDRIMAAARDFIRANQDRPFLCFVPTTVPHLALQVPEDSLKEYEGVFPEDPPYRGDKAYLPHRTPRAAYAAMVTRMDREVGRLMELVEELGLAERTVFVFTSDNGPTYDRLGGSDSDYFHSAGGYRGRKGSLYEGGIRVPLIVRWKGRIAAGTVSDRVCGFEDWLPTLLSLAGAANRIPAGVDGVDFSATLLGRSQPPREFLYREFPGYGGQQCIRVGDWKLVRQNLWSGRGSTAESRTELYHLGEDPGETTDLAGRDGGTRRVVRRLTRLLAREHRASLDFPFPVLDEAVRESRRVE